MRGLVILYHIIQNNFASATVTLKRKGIFERHIAYTGILLQSRWSFAITSIYRKKVDVIAENLQSLTSSF